MSQPECLFPDASPQSTIHPIGVYSLLGLATDKERLLSVDSLRGYLLGIAPQTNDTIVLNPYCVADWIGARGLTLWDDKFWFAKEEDVFWCDRQTLTPTLFARLAYPVNGIAICESSVYVSCQKSGYIQIFDRATGEPGERFPQPGVGTETLTIHQDALWVCDLTEQTVYCLDKLTGKIQFSAITPFPSPTGIAFITPATGAEPICYIVYADEEPYIRDNPNAESPYQLTFRDRTFIHPLYIQQHPAEHYTLSNGYLIELSYIEELLPLEAVTINQVEWRIALPSNTLRQRIRSIEPIGREFTIEEKEGQKVAVFKFDRIEANQGGLFGWKATIEMYGLKYALTPADIDDSLSLSPELQALYLVDDDDLAMDTPIIIEAAKAAVGTETNVLRKMLKIRNYVYDRLSYGIQPRIDTPDVALARGVGSCGEYVGVLLALSRLNGIACRTIGRYKCPQHPELRHLPLQPDFNHVWLEFYVPGIGWLPMESNVDDIIDRGPYPERFFMGLAWYHTEIGKGISFEKMKAADKPEHLSMGDLAINHIRFRILDELIPNLSC
ncbi:transglutaminase domain-containing protein [Chamaesiphon sp. GL140_3_metabinner_50]|uniref:transglutaminase domain-containing protein n=1 Tax=Chamaesiphon sp. GL140_3_metabinner_50 TaxID=2970812 RepID=UPI0025D6C3A2|nr:transglutaminase domain-containing protein [Chamaesiphon sp. GL140_3_metabinner_50]